ncbi:MAG: peptidoglycan-binding protein [Clostridia bacterium]|nr:peptidoglycan-binding protein [Clostridia bacterium]
MKRLWILFACLLAFAACAAAETILWEDDNGTVIIGDGGEVRFIDPDGVVTDLFTIEETPVPDASPTPVPAETVAPVSGFVFRRALRYGDSGDAVKALQQRLLDLGYYEARVSGGYYKVTRTAVRKFQQYNGLAVDGVAGRETQELLFSAGAVPASATPKPTATPAPMPYMLMVDVTNQITRAYTYDEDGDYTVLVREMICSTGTRQNPTPLGTYTMPKSRARWGYFPTWDSHAQYLTRIDSANAFHSVLYTEPNEMALAVSSYSALGTRQSHGCVRLLVSDAKWIYDNCKAGTKITVYESGLYDPEYTMTLKPPLNKETMRERSLPVPTPTPTYARENWPKKYRTLSRGKTGEDVFMVQMRLTELGYYTGTVTGGYYGGTIEAVKAFQKDHGLKVDGAAGKQTLSVLFSEKSDPTPEPTPVPTPSPDPLTEVPLPPTVG